MKPNYSFAGQVFKIATWWTLLGGVVGLLSYMSDRGIFIGLFLLGLPPHLVGVGCVAFFLVAGLVCGTILGFFIAFHSRERERHNTAENAGEPVQGVRNR
jgi:hypothetical protein